MGNVHFRIVLCGGPDCDEGGSAENRRRVQETLAELGLEGRVAIMDGSCFGKCASGPNIVIGYRVENPDPLIGEAQYFEGRSGEYLYSGIHPDALDFLLQEHLVAGRAVKKLLWKEEPG